MRSTSTVALRPSLAALYSKALTSARVSPRVLCPSTDRIRSSICSRPLEARGTLKECYEGDVPRQEHKRGVVFVQCQGCKRIAQGRWRLTAQLRPVAIPPLSRATAKVIQVAPRPLAAPFDPAAACLGASSLAHASRGRPRSANWERGISRVPFRGGCGRPRLARRVKSSVQSVYVRSMAEANAGETSSEAAESHAL